MITKDRGCAPTSTWKAIHGTTLRIQNRNLLIYSSCWEALPPKQCTLLVRSLKQQQNGGIWKTPCKCLWTKLNRADSTKIFSGFHKDFLADSIKIFLADSTKIFTVRFPLCKCFKIRQCNYVDRLDQCPLPRVAKN